MIPPTPHRPLTPDVLKRVAPLLRNVSHPVRLQILDVIGAGESTPSELADITGLPIARISQHLTGMRQLGIVAPSAVGRTRRYRVVMPSILGVLDCIRKHNPGAEALAADDAA